MPDVIQQPAMSVADCTSRCFGTTCASSAAAAGSPKPARDADDEHDGVDRSRGPRVRSSKPVSSASAAALTTSSAERHAHDRTAIATIGDVPAVQGQRDRRNRFDQAEVADRQLAAGQFVNREPHDDDQRPIAERLARQRDEEDSESRARETGRRCGGAWRLVNGASSFGETSRSISGVRRPSCKALATRACIAPGIAKLLSSRRRRARRRR